jgi:heme o synthase
VALIIGAAGVYNNVLDIDIDKLMQRTKKRPMASGLVNPRNALIYGTVLLISGTLTLYIFSNWIVVVLGVTAVLWYVVIYGYFKRKSHHGTLVGAIPGAIPPLAGCVAASGSINSIGLTTFFILVFWQMPHFYAIALYRLQDYKKAKIPILPLTKGFYRTKKEIIVYLLLFMFAAAYLFYMNAAGWVYVISLGIASISWLYLSIIGLFANNTEKWAKKMFIRSLIILLLFSLLLMLNVFLP